MRMSNKPRLQPQIGHANCGRSWPARLPRLLAQQENRATEIPGVTLYRRTAPTAPCSMTYQPGVTVMAQGRKRVDLGSTTFIYGESRLPADLGRFADRQPGNRSQ